MTEEAAQSMRRTPMPAKVCTQDSTAQESVLQIVGEIEQAIYVLEASACVFVAQRLRALLDTKGATFESVFELPTAGNGGMSWRRTWRNDRRDAAIVAVARTLKLSPGAVKKLLDEYERERWQMHFAYAEQNKTPPNLSSVDALCFEVLRWCGGKVPGRRQLYRIIRQVGEL